MYTFYTLISAEKKANEESMEFLVSQECKEHYEEDGVIIERKRKFLLFSTAEEYYEKIESYPHCHEMVFKRNGRSRGRLVFDFDMKMEDYHEGLEDKIEQRVKEIIEKNYKNVNTALFDFVWLNSVNPKKISKHLTVKNCFLEDWLIQTKYIYRKLEETDIGHLIDIQLARNKASLRLPLNAKMGGNPLLFETNHCFFDGLIYPTREQRDREYRVSLYQQNYVPLPKPKAAPIEDEKIQQAIKKIDSSSLIKEQFEVLSHKDNVIQLKRIKPGKCPISDKQHESDNACIIVTEEKELFHCYRGCRANGKACISLNFLCPVPVQKKRAFISDKRRKQMEWRKAMRRL